MNWHYEIIGDRTNPAIIFLHGFMGSHADWLNIAGTLSDKFCSILIDLPGHGKTVSEKREHYAFPLATKNLVSLIKELELIKPNLVGYSMGGRLAFYLAVYNGEQFDKVIIESASPGLKTEYERTARIQLDENRAQKLLSIPFEQFVTEWYGAPLFYSLKNHKNFSTIFQQRLKNDPHKLALSLQNMGTGIQESLWKKLGTIKNNILLITGENDYKFKTIATEMAENITHSRLVVLPDCGHTCHIENETDFTNEIQHFLED